MYSRSLSHQKHGSFFLMGPRGTGKSSWVRTEYPHATYIDLLDSENFTELTASPKRLSRYLPEDRKTPIIIDEVQKVPALLNEVHRLIESEKLRFILTGSSARKLRQAGVNLLAGRAKSLAMFPLTAHEIGKSFDLKYALRYGSLPGCVNDPEPKKFLKSYVQTYLREEVQQEGLVRSLPAFARFLEAASFSQGGVLSLTAVAEDAGVPRKSVENYFDILEDLMIGVRVPVFTRRAKRKATSHPKFYFFDAGVYRALRPQGPLDTPEELDGAALETLVFQELRALNSYLDLEYSIHFWRTSTQEEVDFILYGERGLLAFEVKRSDRVRAGDLKALNMFVSDYPMARAYYLYGGTRRFKEGAVEVVPLTEFFAEAAKMLSEGRGRV